jgi:hypothetical protein
MVASGSNTNPTPTQEKAVLKVAAAFAQAAKILGLSADPIRDYYAALNALRGTYWQ